MLFAIEFMSFARSPCSSYKAQLPAGFFENPGIQALREGIVCILEWAQKRELVEFFERLESREKLIVNGNSYHYHSGISFFQPESRG